MDKDLLLVLIGGLVGLVSSVASAILTHQLDSRRLKAQLDRESALRQAEREREDQLRREEREREDRLRREEREREDQQRQDELRRQSALREADALWRDIERKQKALDAEDNAINRAHLQRLIEDLSRRRAELLEEHRQLISKDREKSDAE